MGAPAEWGIAPLGLSPSKGGPSTSSGRAGLVDGEARAQLAQIDQQLRQAEDVVRAEVQDAFSALERAFEFYQQARRRVELARLVARAEREQLRLGRSDVLRVTLREQAAFDAEVVEVGAQQDYFRALADFWAVLGTSGRRTC